MVEKLKQANNNIKELVKEVVKMRREKNSMYCIHPKERYSIDKIENFCDDKCDECKDKYYKDMEEYLLEKYQI